MTITILLWVIAIALILAGFAGLVLPALPGAPLLFAGLVFAAWADDFVYVGAKILFALGIMATLSYVLEFAASALGARRFGASPRAITGATIGAVVGIFFGLPGILLGPFLGAVVGELTAQRDFRTAAGSGAGAFLGLLLATAGKLALGFAMLGIFLLVRFV